MAEDKDMLSVLRRIEEQLQSIDKWLRFANMDKLQGIVASELEDDRKKLAFEYSDGSRGYREVGELAGAPRATVQGWWARWFTMGIMVPSPTRAGRVQRICSLHDLGFDIPQGSRQSRTDRKHYYGDDRNTEKENMLEKGDS